MKLIKLNNNQADKIRGNYKPFHDCEPVFIEDDFHIIHEEMEIVPEIDKKLKIKDLPKFTIGDKSVDDKKYKAKKDKDSKDIEKVK